MTFQICMVIFGVTGAGYARWCGWVILPAFMKITILAAIWFGLSRMSLCTGDVGRRACENMDSHTQKHKAARIQATLYRSSTYRRLLRHDTHVDGLDQQPPRKLKESSQKLTKDQLQYTTSGGNAKPRTIREYLDASSGTRPA